MEPLAPKAPGTDKDDYDADDDVDNDDADDEGGFIDNDEISVAGELCNAIQTHRVCAFKGDRGGRDTGAAKATTTKKV